MIKLFGQRIRELRQQKDLTMKELGKFFDLAESTISGYENEARKPDIYLLQKLADFFNVSVDYILGRSDIPFSKKVDNIETSNSIIINGVCSELTKDEVSHIKDCLEMFRLLKAKRNSEKQWEIL